MTPLSGPTTLFRSGALSRVIQGYFPGGRPNILAASPAPSAPVRPQVPAPTHARPASLPAPIVPVRPAPGALQPALRPGNLPRPIVATRPQLGALQPATPPRTPAPRPIVPPAPKPATVQPQADNSFVLPSNFTLKPRGSGQPLPETVQKKMESFFNTSFADVRIHVGHEAPTIGALAFTHGNDLYFAPGQYNPQSTQGQQLLGHELTHVLQQRAGRVRNPPGAGVAVVQDPALEAEAERMGLRAASASVPVQAKPSATGPGPGVASPQPSGPGPSKVTANGSNLPARSLAHDQVQRKLGPILPGKHSAPGRAVPDSAFPPASALLPLQAKLAQLGPAVAALRTAGIGRTTELTNLQQHWTKGPGPTHSLGPIQPKSVDHSGTNKTSCPPPRRPAGAQVAQPYFVVNSNNFAASNVVTHGASFDAQESGGNANHPTSFLVNYPVNTALNIVANQNANLRISDDGLMAIEDTVLANRQAKVFFADEAVIKASNRALKANHSYFRLKINKAAYVLVPDVQGIQLTKGKSIFKKRRRLYAVTPKRVFSGNSQGYDTTIASDCTAAAGEVLGEYSALNFKPKLAGNLVDLRNSIVPVEATAHFLAENVAGRAAGARASAEALNPSDPQTAKGIISNLNQQNALDYGPAAAAGGHLVLDPLVSTLGVNEFARADVGEAYGVFSVADVAGGQAFDHRRNANVVAWRSHWAGVVAQSGGDTVTLENYTRVAEDQMGANNATYFFQMYGSGANQTWHDQWRDDAANAISLAFTKL
jgi:hypothetical protein